MKLRMVLAALAMIGLGGAANAADDKTDVKKMIVGKWEAVKADEGTLPTGSIIEFTADGKLKVTAKKDDKKESFEGTYTVDGSSFTFKLKIMDQEISEKISVTKISATELDTKNKEDKVVTFKKVK